MLKRPQLAEFPSAAFYTACCGLKPTLRAASKSNLRQIVRKRMLDFWKHFGGKSPQLTKFLPQRTRQVNERDAFDRTAIQIGENCFRCEVGKLADKQVDGFGEQRRQIFGSAQVRAMRNAAVCAFQQKTIRGKIGR